uniref:Plasminogen-like n=1 Tax=Crassostrea virginica TaxID=6565 RepID=A0A8B8CFQ0_CRAVI|nr:plasminogen-like [Crassostrea virginica]
MSGTLIVCALMHLVIIEVSSAVITYPNCKLTIEGMEYRGNISVTTSGRKCQRWDSHSPHTHEYDRLFHGGASVNKNYCRNPKANDEPTPWCYTTDPDVRFELCDVPVCECRETPNGETYIGMLSHTVYGNQCLRWDSLNASNPEYAAVLNLKGNISSHANYCRNPDRKTAPWCFVGGDLQWEYCDIPFCKRDSSECLRTPQGLDYFGTNSRTSDNIECQRWDKQEPNAHAFATEFMGLSVSEHKNYCRNPDSRERPWCYTVNSTVPFQYCDIPYCPEDTYYCDFSNENCVFDQENTNMTNWTLFTPNKATTLKCSIQNVIVQNTPCQGILVSSALKAFVVKLFIIIPWGSGLEQVLSTPC